LRLDPAALTIAPLTADFCQSGIADRVPPANAFPYPAPYRRESRNDGRRYDGSKREEWMPHLPQAKPGRSA